MGKLYQHFDKDTFVPEKNYFSTEQVRCEREETPEEERLWDLSDKWTTIGWNCIGWGCLIGFIGAITFGCLGGMLEQPLWYIGAGLCITLFLGVIIFANAVCWPKENSYFKDYKAYMKEHEEELWKEARKELDAYNEEQKRIAEAWRAEHPLEEKIRACLRDPLSSVDIANLARYYAACYLKGDTGPMGPQGPKGDCPRCPFEEENK